VRRHLDGVEGRLLRMVVAVEASILGDLPDAASVRHLEERWRGRRQGGIHVPPPSFEIGSFDLDRHEVPLS
jgi:hypothetical protein